MTPTSLSIREDLPWLALAPELSPLLASLLTETDLLHALVDGLGSPLNVVLPEQVRSNVSSFRAVYNRHRLNGTIFFAHKANRSSALVRELADTEAGIDVASLGELQHALGAGFTPDRVMATGPKNAEFLWLAARTGVTVNVDSLQELADLADVVDAHQLGLVRVLVRFSGFSGSGTAMLSRPSRFGVHVDELPALLDVVESRAAAVQLVGVAYHLDTIGIPEKAIALEGCLDLIDECAARGHYLSTVDIGGGFGVNYLAHPQQWSTYTTALSEAVLGRRTPITWQGYGYGLRSEHGTLRGALGLYPASRSVAGPDYLDTLLRTSGPSQGQPLATALLDRLLAVHTEPGRALLDQCGAVLTRVLEVRHSTTGDTFVRVEMNAGDASLEEHGVVMDPVLIPRDAAGVDSRPPGQGFLIGNLCLEADFISRRRVAFVQMPQRGDLLAFVNTAGYFMDFSADHALHQPSAVKVAASRGGTGWRWCHDEQYWPTRSRPAHSGKIPQEELETR